MWFFIALFIALVIVGIVKAINGDDGKPWPHPGENDTHHWK